MRTPPSFQVRARREEVVARLVVDQRVDVSGDQALHPVGDEGVVVDRVEGLLLVILPHQVALVAVGVDRLVGRQDDAGGVLGGNVQVLPQWRHRPAEDPVGHALVGDAGDVVGGHAAAALGGQDILAAQLQAAGLAAALREGDRQLELRLLVRLVARRIGVAMQVAADDGLRLVPLGDVDRLDAACLADPGVEADEVDEVGPLQQQLGHDRVVVVVLRQMAVGAGLGLGLALGVRVVRRKAWLE